MKKKSKIILGVCIVAAALIGMSVWNTWFSATKIAFVNFQTIQQGSISKANDNLSIKLSEVSLDNLDRLTGYDMEWVCVSSRNNVNRYNRLPTKVFLYILPWLPTRPTTFVIWTAYNRI